MACGSAVPPAACRAVNDLVTMIRTPFSQKVITMRASLMLAIWMALSVGPLVAQTTASLSPRVREYVSVDAPVVALTHARVIDGTGGPILDNQTVVIANRRIKAVGATGTLQVPAGARVMDLTGHTVIPGMVGLHDHTLYTTRNRIVQISFTASRLYLATGVTTIRTTGALEPYSEINLKADIERGEVPGPRMHLTGPHITGGRPFEYGQGMRIEWMRHVSTPEEARRAVAYWAEEGADWIKLYTEITRAEVAAIVDEAHKRGVKVTGHLCSITFREAAALGMDNVEHGLLTNTDYHPQKERDVCPADRTAGQLELDMSSEPVQATFRDMVAKHVAMTSTLVVFEPSVPNRPPLDQRVLDAMAPEVRAEVLKSRAEVAAQPARPAGLLKKAMEYEVAFVKAGGLLAAGSDPTGYGAVLPGFGDQRNYELFIEAGFTPAQAVQILSANGAKVLGTFDRLGTVTAGKLADLVVIKGDPARNPADFKKVVTVFKDGVGYDSAKLIAAVRGLVGVR